MREEVLLVSVTDASSSHGLVDTELAQPGGQPAMRRRAQTRPVVAAHGLIARHMPSRPPCARAKRRRTLTVPDPGCSGSLRDAPAKHRAFGLNSYSVAYFKVQGEVMVMGTLTAPTCTMGPGGYVATL